MSMMIHRNRKKKNQREVSHEENLPFFDSDIEFEERPKEQQYTKTDIQRMSKDDLVSLASEIGIEGAEKMNGADLKRELVEHFEL